MGVVQRDDRLTRRQPCSRRLRARGRAIRGSPARPAGDARSARGPGERAARLASCHGPGADARLTTFCVGSGGRSAEKRSSDGPHSGRHRTSRSVCLLERGRRGTASGSLSTRRSCAEPRGRRCRLRARPGTAFSAAGRWTSLEARFETACVWADPARSSGGRRWAPIRRRPPSQRRSCRSASDSRIRGRRRFVVTYTDSRARTVSASSR